MNNFSKNNCFNYTFVGKNNLKEIYNTWDLFISGSINEGNSHFSFTINIPLDWEYLDHYRNILKLHPIIKPKIDNNDPEFWNTKYSKYKELESLYTCGSTYNPIREYLIIIMHYSGATPWIFVITEENKNGLVHFHGIFAIKNIMDYNLNISTNILNKIKEFNRNSDVVIKNLNKFKDIKNWIRYIHKNKTWVFKPLWFTQEQYLKRMHDHFYICYKNNYEMHNQIDENINESIDFTILENPYFLEYDINLMLFKGCILKKNSIQENLFIDLILYYLILNEYYVYKDSIYKKVQNYKISYIIIGSIKEILFENFQTNVLSYVEKRYPCHTIGVNFWYLIKNFKLKSEQNILKITTLLLPENKIELDFSLMEFSDGIYDMKTNKFIKNNYNTFSNKKTTKFYNQTYDYTRRMPPKIWLESITHALDNNKDSFLSICFFISQLFKNKDNNLKKKYLYVYGPTNTGKTTLITNVLNRYFGKENVGSSISDNNFKYQEMYDKILIIIDEFKYNPNRVEDLLKLLGGETLLIPSKYEKKHIIVAGLMGIILSNNLEILKETDKAKLRALLSRLFISEFKNIPNKNIIEINKKLYNEEAQIFIFCNKLSFYNNNKFNEFDKKLLNDFVF